MAVCLSLDSPIGLKNIGGSSPFIIGTVDILLTQPNDLLWGTPNGILPATQYDDVIESSMARKFKPTAHSAVSRIRTRGNVILKTKSLHSDLRLHALTPSSSSLAVRYGPSNFESFYHSLSESSRVVDEQLVDMINGIKHI